MNLRKLLSMLTVMAALPCALCGCIQQAVTGSPEITGTVEILPTPTATVRVDEINGIFVDAINGSDAGHPYIRDDCKMSVIVFSQLSEIKGLRREKDAKK